MLNWLHNNTNIQTSRCSDRQSSHSVLVLAEPSPATNNAVMLYKKHDTTDRLNISRIHNITLTQQISVQHKLHGEP